jgi:DNA/RNA-binding domain of Phe-tRNA-synthetase-like protein
MMPIVDEHPLLDPRVFITEFSKPIGELETPTEILKWLSLDSPALVSVDTTTKPKVRDLLRHGGYKPTGRGKPASEYLRQAVEKGILSSINLPVDACNAASLQSGLPISVVDFDLIQSPLRISTAPEDSEYVFNVTGQTIKLDGLLCLFDAAGPCANAVKDSQRTKTSETTTRTLSVVWGTNELDGQSEKTKNWYRELLDSADAKTVEVDYMSS